MPSSRTSSMTSLSVPLVVLLFIGAGVAFGLGLAQGITAIVDFSQQNKLTSQVLFDSLHVIVMGGAVALLLIAAGVIVRLAASHLAQAKYDQAVMDQLRTSVLQIEQVVRSRAVAMAGNIPSQPPVVTSENAVSGGGDPQQMLNELRDLLLMNDHQRTSASRRHWDQRKEDQIRLVERSIAMDDWEVALIHVQELKTILPDDPIGEDMARRVESVQAERRRSDLEGARGQIRQLISANGWVQAEEIVARLDRRYPMHPDVEILRMELAQEREAVEHENLQRLFNELRDATDQRQWRRALLAAEELLRRYPEDRQVARLQLDLPTLRENAEAQERREEEALFKELLHRQRYEEAIGVARHLIDRFPSSSAAQELNKLLPKVEELSRQENQKRIAPAA